jgi:hypothetical protein
MKRRGGSIGGRGKRLHHRTTRAKARKAPISPVSAAELQQQLYRCTSELENAHQQQAATAEILRMISNSPTDIRSVLHTVAESAARLCEAVNVVIFRLEGELLRQVVVIGDLPSATEPPGVLLVNRGTVTGRAVIERRTIHVQDTRCRRHRIP